MPCKCQDRDVWEVLVELAAAEADPRLPVFYRNLARIAREHLERLSRRA
jgi:hypothetical protein